MPVATPGVAAQQTAQAQLQPAPETMALNGLCQVLRAGRGEAAGRHQPGRNQPLVQANATHGKPREDMIYPAHRRSLIFFSTACMFCSITA